MNRRSVLKAITGITAATGMEMNPTYITARDVAGVEVVVLKIPRGLTCKQVDMIKQQWTQDVEGTVLGNMRLIVLPKEMELELVRTRQS